MIGVFVARMQQIEGKKPGCALKAVILQMVEVIATCPTLIAT
jgi:hypothetical protein